MDTERHRAAYDALTPAQRIIFGELLTGRSVPEIAERFGRSAHTVSNHERAVFRAFKVRSRPMLMALFVMPPFGLLRRRPSISDPRSFREAA